MRTAAVIQLRWKSYLGDLRALLQRLRCSEELTDVVLTNGSTSVRCHRVILSAACQTFHDLLKEHAGDVVICLGGVDSSDLSSLVDYMYSGEVEVAQGRLSDFLALAAQWGVRGLEDTARSASQPTTKASGARGSTSEQTAEDRLPRVIEINSSAASPGHVSRRSESSAADSTSRRKGRPRPDDSDSSSEEKNERVRLPAATAAAGSTSRRFGRSQSTDSDSSSEEESKARVPDISIVTTIHPNAERKSKKCSTPLVSKSAEPQTSSAPDSANKTKSPKVSKKTKSHRAASTSVPGMFACPHCPRVFVKPSYFESHLKSQHNDRTHSEQHRLKISTETGRVVQLAGGILMKLPSTTSNKKKTAQPEEIKKKKEKRKTAQERAAEAVAAADAAAVRAALEQAADISIAGLPEATRVSGSAKKAPARDVIAAPAKRARIMSSSSDSDSDSSVEVTKISGGKTPGPVAASTPVTTATTVRPLPTTVRPPPAPVPTPPGVVQPPVTSSSPPMLWPQLSHPPPVIPPRIKPLLGLAPQAASDSPRPSRIVFDQDGQPQPATAAPEPQVDVKPIITPLLMIHLPQTTQGGARPATAATTAAAATSQGRDERRLHTERSQSDSARQRRDLHGAESDSGRGTRIVFDQEGRPRPAAAAPPPPPPVGIATHVRRESTGRDDPRPTQDRDRQPAADRGWQRDRDRDRDLDRDRAKSRDRDRDWDRAKSQGRDQGRAKSQGRDIHRDQRGSWEDREDPWLRREYGFQPPHSANRQRLSADSGSLVDDSDPHPGAGGRGRSRGRGRGDPSHGARGRGRGDPSHGERARGRGRGDPSHGERARGRGRGDPSHGELARGHSQLHWRRVGV